MALLLSLSAYAGLRGVGTGGGFGEMQAHLADEKLPELLEACLKTGCGVSPTDCELILGDKRELKTDTKCTGTIADAKSVTISSCDLYEFSQNGQLQRPRPFNEILAVVYAARSGRPLEQALAFLRNLTVNKTSTALTSRDSELAQHFLDIRLGEKRIISLSIEGANETLEISDLLIPQLNCEGRELIWELGRTLAVAGNDDRYLAESDINWICGGTHRRGKLRVYLHYPNHKLESGNIQVRLSERKS
jgi:hypothetical protein